MENVWLLVWWLTVLYDVMYDPSQAIYSVRLAFPSCGEELQIGGVAAPATASSPQLQAKKGRTPTDLHSGFSMGWKRWMGFGVGSSFIESPDIIWFSMAAGIYSISHSGSWKSPKKVARLLADHDESYYPILMGVDHNNRNGDSDQQEINSKSDLI